jgi:hypothetical protein
MGAERHLRRLRAIFVTGRPADSKNVVFPGAKSVVTCMAGFAAGTAILSAAGDVRSP